MLSGYLGLLLLGGGFVALGLFISSLTSNQMVAGAASFVVFLLLWIIGWFVDSVGPRTGEVLSYLSIIEHFDDFGKGIIDTKHIVYLPEFHRLRSVPRDQVGGHRSLEGLTVKRLIGILGWLGVALVAAARHSSLHQTRLAGRSTRGWPSPAWPSR